MLGRIDRIWAGVEKVIVVGGFLVMAAVVFVNAVHRTFADTAWQSPLGLAITWGGLLLVVLAGIRTGSRALPRAAPAEAQPPAPAPAPDAASAASAAAPVAAAEVAANTPVAFLEGPPMPWGRAVGLAAAGTLGVAALTYGFTWLLPSGIVGAESIALVIFIWVAFFGASVATRESRHLKIDAADRLLKGSVKRWVGLVSNLFAGAFCGALAVLAVLFCLEKYRQYAETDGASGTFFAAVPIPEFVAFGALPVAFTVMSLRFVAHAVRSARGLTPEGTTLHGLTLPDAGPDGKGTQG